MNKMRDEHSSNNLLATVDSLELVHTTKSSNPSNKNDNLEHFQLMLRKLPSYMRIPNSSPSKIQHSMKMSENYSNKLVDERRRSSALRFSEASDDNGKTLAISSLTRPRGGSILSQSPSIYGHTSSQSGINFPAKENPLSEIYEKCYENLGKMKIDEILMMLSGM